MSVTILRTADAWWVQTADGASKVDTAAVSTGELLADRAAIDAAATGGERVPVDGLRLMSPVTTPCRVVAQMTNFASHVKDAGMDPNSTPLTFFRKASGSISGPFDDIVKPAHVRFLDYEVEIGLVIARELPVGATVTAANWSDYVGGLVVTNDVSARDIQLPKPSSTKQSRIRRSPRSDRHWCCWMPASSGASASCGCGCGSMANCARTCAWPAT
ncbi:hypothetical protein NIIDMKKI_27050 [Mycobacterium kansasii]|uniref:Fumarylacetoacetase-like C-terminal domain-containing protein n=1 Tax=Mycobacterium kansasii TaxID=1768 RepID=A0A7G1ID65_MYCKA|nr:hypothetical protein NIIDMKKI_27050 [Mycobacterium kansasii]